MRPIDESTTVESSRLRSTPYIRSTHNGLSCSDQVAINTLSLILFFFFFSLLSFFLGLTFFFRFTLLFFFSFAFFFCFTLLFRFRFTLFFSLSFLLSLLRLSLFVIIFRTYRCCCVILLWLLSRLFYFLNFDFLLCLSFLFRLWFFLYLSFFLCL